jgi:uncharacterized protein YkwD
MEYVMTAGFFRTLNRLRPLAAAGTIVTALALFAGGLSSHPGAQGSTTLDAEEQSFLTALNQYRAASGLAALTIDPMLQDAAEWMSTDMATNNYFSHTDSLGRDPFQRMAAFGYTYNTWKGENLAAGVADGQTAFTLWQGSPGHNANMLGANYRVIGIARAYGPSSGYGWYWTTDFGGVASSPPSQPTPSPTATPSPAPTATPTPSPAATPPPPGLDSDGDSFGATDAAGLPVFSDSREAYTRTDPSRRCPLTTQAGDEGTDAWPPDFDDNQAVNILDVLAVRSAWGVPWIPGVSERFDLTANGALTTTDLLQIKPFFGTNCTTL